MSHADEPISPPVAVDNAAESVASAEPGVSAEPASGARPAAAAGFPPAAAAQALSHAELARAVGMRDQVVAEVARVYIGEDRVIIVLLAALLARGHVLLEGVPGLAKTTLAKAVARVLGCDYRRLQFTPDLLPADITGTFIFNPKSSEFELRRGPLFAQLVLADEINRAPAKTQSALLEAMQERQVTIDGLTLGLPMPFLVLATQNPVEQEGVYLLPEAQVDRFLVRIRLDYPTTADEVQMLQTYNREVAEPEPVASVTDVIALSDLVDRVHVEERVMRYAVRLIQATRSHGRVALGASPRASLGLIRMAKAWALLAGRDYVSPDDLRLLSPVVLEHRVMVTTDAAIEGTTAADVVRDVLRTTPVMETSREGSATLPPAPGGNGGIHWAGDDA